MPVAQDKMFTHAMVEKGTFNDEERSFVAWASTSVQDRDGEKIAHNAWDTVNFARNPVVLWAHDYSERPVAKTLWIKRQKNGLKFKPQFAPTEMGRETYLLYKEGYLNAFSVGFIPKDFEEDEDEMVEFVGFFGGKFTKPLLTYTDVELLEISCVPVPSCPDALVERLANGLIKTKGLQKAIKDTTSKTVIPFKHYALDDEDSAWDGPSERRDADISDLKVMATWFDSESPDTKSSYKLPHHRADGHNTVWRGTAAAMVALLGGRGGVDIPDGDRRAVYNHLERHYGEFDKPVPEFKHYTEADLKAMDVEPKLESVETSGGKVEGGWEAVEDIEERDPVEIMRQNGLEKEKDGMVPVTTELWNSIMDGYATMQANSVEAFTTHEHEESDEEIEAKQIELTADETAMLVQQALKIRRQADVIEQYGHSLKVLNAKLEVLQGGIG